MRKKNTAVVTISDDEFKDLIKECVHGVLMNEGYTDEDDPNRAYGFGDFGWVDFITHDNGTIEVDFVSQEKNGEEALDIAYENFIVKLKPFINTASKNDYQILLSEPKKGMDANNRNTLKLFIKIIDSEGNASTSIAPNGYEYCATVVPISASTEKDKYGYRGIDKSVNIPALVTMAPKYRNSNLSSILKDTHTEEKCAGCGRTIPRGQYIIYIDTKTNKILHLGTNCAVNKFGYSLKNNFANRLAMMFSTVSYDDLVAHNPDGDPITPNLKLRSISNRTYTDDIMKAIAYHAMTDPKFNIKSYGYERIESDAKMMLMPHAPGHKNYYWGKDRYDRKALIEFSPKVMQMREWFENNGDKIPSYAEYAEFWEKKEPVGDWENMCKTVAMAMINESFVASKYAAKFEKIVPYTILMFIREKDAPEVEKMDVKEGDKIENIKCKLVETKYFESYRSYLVKLKDTQGHLFSYWSKRDTIGMAEKNLIIKSAVVKGMRGNEINLNYVELTSEDKEAEIAQRNKEVNAMQYPDDKTRLRNVPMKVVEIRKNQEGDPASAVVEDENGCKYYIFLIKTYMGYAPKIMAFPYNEGDTINVTGTVERKEGRNGLYYSLSRVILK